MKHGHLRFVLVVFLLVFSAFAQSHPASQPTAYDLKAHYTKAEYQIPMRDGVRLFTAVYVPKDKSHAYPFLVTRTPYSIAPYGEDKFPRHLGPSDAFERAGYIFVVQDVRGQHMSEGTFVEVRPHPANPKPGDTNESTDMYDTVEWLLKNVPYNNGKVGIWGISYPGFYTSASIINSHPAIKAASPEAPMTDLFKGDDTYHNGTFMLAANFLFYSGFKLREGGPKRPPADGWFREYDYGTTDGYEFFLKHGPSLPDLGKLLKNPLFDDAYEHNTEDQYWLERDISQHLSGIKCAVLTVGGWFDAEDPAGPFRTYAAIEKNNPGISNTLVMGPWVHGGWSRYEGASLGRVKFNSSTAAFYREHIVFPFFEQHLKGTTDAKLPEAYVFETGSNVWRQYPAWPPKNTQSKTLYLHGNGKLSFDPPAAGESTYDEYVSDPAHPVPFINYSDTGVPQEYMVSDQRFASKRPDVLTYVSEPLAENITIAGPIAPKLHVSTSGTDTDFVVKVIDVYPGDFDSSSGSEETPRRPKDVGPPTDPMGGYQQLVRGEPMRAKFRNSWQKPEAMTPNEVTAVNFEMPDVNHTFLKGHRIMVQIQSSWFPLTELNPQKFMDTAKASKTDFVKATQRVYHTPQQSSGVVVGLIPQP